MMVKKVDSSYLPSVCVVSFPKTAKVVLIAVAALFSLVVLAGIIVRSLSGRVLPPPRRPQHPPQSSPPPSQPAKPAVQPKSEYPPNLIEVLGGIEKFMEIPTLLATETEIVDVNTDDWSYSFVKISPEKMTAPVMKGKDAYNRKFIVYRYQDRESKAVTVDVLYCRDSKEGAWSFNDEYHSESFSMEKGSILDFLYKLSKNKHAHYQFI